ncbi:uncharacterized protein PFL1_01912 [Pseudozyma flocculosa PF-1]|uniref:Related to D-amino-acid oxidase n=1 Tax=Pseudozyma flocculosa TaxID=84751 RepID=A0A5C3F017_9BASI|nr:uncharacterized protein PFL1_01912 [Pseudozyma flocculosa PF-1]EPQ30386.1 hypothetical protein PFL1_01912 [Pseudozyma flocculosa PF-1]SPO37460.1 related to D-amino-acid oxidase [Pseudozyma flocculosa]
MGSSSHAKTDITILGAGVTSLTAAYELRAAGYAVHIFARDLPSDSTSQAFASPWAGANWCTFAKTPQEQRRDHATFRRWTQLNKTLPDETMAMMDFTHFFDQREELWFRDVVFDFKEIPAIPGSQYGTSYRSFTISVPNYTAWLVSELTSASPRHIKPSGSRPLRPPVTIQRTSTVASLADAASLHPASSLIINATGLGAAALDDVRDAAVHPIRGQTLLVSVPAFTGKDSIARCVMKPGQPTLYVIPRAQSGLVILGGSFEVGSDQKSPNDAMTDRILEGCVDICPQLLWQDPQGRRRHADWKELKQKGLVGINVGLRPGREGGARVERGDKVRGRSGSAVDVIHAYGIAASGYQSSFGIAEEVAQLVEQWAHEGQARQARL